MIFSTYSFIFLFLPIVWLGYFGLHHAGRHKAAKWFLVAASFAFYAIGSADFVLIFMASVAVNYAVGTRVSLWRGKNIHPVAMKLLFAVGIALNIALLAYFKYTDFFIKNYNWLFSQNVAPRNIVLPIGISFFTFQLIAYQVDSFRGLTSSYSLLDYLLFITFFPQLIVGPIVHHGEMVPQFEDRKNWRVNWDNVAKGMFVFTIGLGKKVLLADPMTLNAQSFFDHAIPAPVSALSAWWYSIEYTISYYFDLSAYADMAIGIGLMFNVIIPENFNAPYKARNFQDYWQRWHMTLSRFLGAYIFRSVYRKGSRWRNYYIATMITFLVSGFWHGAGWHFIAWGLVNGALVCIASGMKRRNYSLNTVLAHALTLLGIVLTRIMFVVPLKRMLVVFRSLVHFSSMEFSAGNGATYLMLLRLILSLVILFCMPTTATLARSFSPSAGRLVRSSLVAGLCVALMGRAAVFLYFQF